jgi:phosphatidylglycerol:prolipoprotein diacylglycerol transferase
VFPSIPIASGFSLSSYFLLISLGTTLSVIWFIRRAEARKLDRVTSIDLALCVLIGGFLGARLLHIFFEEPELYQLNPRAVLEIWNGGFVYLGGVIGALVASVAFCKYKSQPFWYWADVATPPIALGYAIGRFACFFNGCCYGLPAQVPWAITVHGAPRHPTQLYATLWELAVLAILIVLQSRFKTSGMLFNTWLLLHGLGRILMEVFRDDPRGSLILGVSLGTNMSVVLMTWALFNIVASRLHR